MKKGIGLAGICLLKNLNIKMEELSFNAIKKEIHLKKCVYNAKRKDREYFKEWKTDKLTFYKDYKSKMIWFNSYGIGIENNKFFKVDNTHFQIQTDKTEINIYLII